MNERIVALFRKAGGRTSFDVESSPYQFEQEELEKFAELIVKECAKFLDDNSGYDDANNAWHPEPKDLLKHFGVTE